MIPSMQKNTEAGNYWTPLSANLFRLKSSVQKMRGAGLQPWWVGGHGGGGVGQGPPQKKLKQKIVETFSKIWKKKILNKIFPETNFHHTFYFSIQNVLKRVLKKIRPILRGGGGGFCISLIWKNPKII